MTGRRRRQRVPPLRCPTFGDQMRSPAAGARRLAVRSAGAQRDHAWRTRRRRGHLADRNARRMGNRPPGYSETGCRRSKAFIDAEPIVGRFRQDVGPHACPRVRHRARRRPGRSAAAGLDAQLPARAERHGQRAGHAATSRSGSAARSPTRTSDGSPQRSCSRCSSGKHDGTDVLAVSFSSPDLVGHAFGPRSHEVQDIYAHLDKTHRHAVRSARCDRRQGSVGRGLSADHGVTPIPDQLVADGKDAGRINGGALVDAIEQVLKPALGRGTPRRPCSTPTTSTSSRASYDKIPQVASADHRRRLGDRGAAGHPARVPQRRDPRRAPSSKDPLHCARRRSATFPDAAAIWSFAAKPGWMISPTGTTHGSANADDQRGAGAVLRPRRQARHAIRTPPRLPTSRRRWRRCRGWR